MTLSVSLGGRKVCVSIVPSGFNTLAISSSHCAPRRSGVLNIKMAISSDEDSIGNCPVKVHPAPIQRRDNGRNIGFTLLH